MEALRSGLWRGHYTILCLALLLAAVPRSYQQGNISASPSRNFNTATNQDDANSHRLALHQQQTSAGDLSSTAAAPTLPAAGSIPASIQAVQPSMPLHTVPAEAPASVTGSVAVTGISPDARKLVFTAPGPRVQTMQQYLTTCRIEGTGSADGTTVAQASISCSGPNTPVQLAISQQLQSFQKDFTGVNVLPSAPDSSALLEIYDEANLAIADSVIFNIPGNLMIRNSTIQVLRSSFILNSGDAAGAMVIDSSQVLVDSCTFNNNTGATGGALESACNRNDACHDIGSATQVTGQSSVGITNTTFIGNVDGNSQGGAFAAGLGGLVQVVNSQFVVNSAIRGGAVYSSGASITILNSQFSSNAARTTGGAIYSENQSALTILNTTFTSNTAGSLGGALAVDSCQTTVAGSIFSGNSARSQGGALFQTNSTGDITTCTFMDNSALAGGAIYANSNSGNILRTAFTGNTATQKGGAVFGESSTGNIMNSTFTGNKASQAGGAVFQDNCASSMSFSIFTQNDAGSGAGGAVYRNACKGFTTQCSFISNTGAEGGALYQNNCIGNNIRNTEFRGNQAEEGSALYLNDSQPIVNGSLFNGSSNPGNTIYQNSQGSQVTSSGG